MKRRTEFKPTKLLLYQQCKRIIESLRCDKRGEAKREEIEGANDLLYRLMCTESITLMAMLLKRRPQDVYNTIDTALHFEYGALKNGTRKEIRERLEQMKKERDYK